jgi:hypothetical protein
MGGPCSLHGTYIEYRYKCLKFLREESTWMVGVITLNCPLTTQQLRDVDWIRAQGFVSVKSAININRRKIS